MFSRSGMLKAANLLHCMGNTKDDPMWPGVGFLWVLVREIGEEGGRADGPARGGGKKKVVEAPNPSPLRVRECGRLVGIVSHLSKTPGRTKDGH